MCGLLRFYDHFPSFSSENYASLCAREAFLLPMMVGAVGVTKSSEAELWEFRACTALRCVPRHLGSEAAMRIPSPVGKGDRDSGG